MKHITFLFLLPILVCCNQQNSAITAMKGKPIPSFKILLSDSTTYFDMKELPKGKPIVLFYFGPRCPYSQLQMKNIIEGINKFKDVQLILFTTASFNEMRMFYNHYHLDKFNIKTGVDYSNYFTNYYKVKGVPYIAIFDKDNNLKEAFEGQTPIEQLESSLEI